MVYGLEATVFVEFPLAYQLQVWGQGRCYLVCMVSLLSGAKLRAIVREEKLGFEGRLRQREEGIASRGSVIVGVGWEVRRRLLVGVVVLPVLLLKQVVAKGLPTVVAF